MIDGKTIAVVVPAYNEETQISIVIETMPSFVDRIVIVDDCSSDSTQDVLMGVSKSTHNRVVSLPVRDKVISSFHNEAEVVLERMNKEELSLFVSSTVVYEYENKQIVVIRNNANAGVGQSIARGYKWCKDNKIDCTAVMAGDAQMDPTELFDICEPVVKHQVDYVKGNRLSHGSARVFIPRTRFLGNSVLSLMTKAASGYWRVSDTQTGFTAISLAALNAIKLYDIYPRYGMPNDMLVKLNIAGCSIREIPIKPVYRIGENSKMKVHKVIPKISWLLFISFLKRIWLKYFINDFHPLFILYNLSLLLFVCCIPFALSIIRYLTGSIVGDKPILNALMFMFLFVSASQSLLFAMWMDIQDNERLYK
ncbi:MAG: glycosyltransferase family 2 protein [Desulfitobacteriaceae bacterium]|jgi:glycosyltransferase involved in cell wall biosynthesis|nr:glycosyltransferase family 2 protein [Desulfitobacteriaceae bacterium]